jgi:hypothetical protein
MKILLIGAILTCLPALAAAQSIRCDGKIINQGITQAEVSARCGPPVQVDRRPAYTGPLGYANGRVITGADDDSEVWTYNFGPSKLMQRISFQGGIVVNVESLGYGF